MADGSLAGGRFNRGKFESPVAVKWTELGRSGRRRVRDLWRQRDFGEYADSCGIRVRRHGAMLRRVRHAEKSAPMGCRRFRPPEDAAFTERRPRRKIFPSQRSDRADDRSAIRRLGSMPVSAKQFGLARIGSPT